MVFSNGSRGLNVAWSCCRDWLFGGALGGSRTPNLLIRSQMLYPLSYERMSCSLEQPLRIMAGLND